MKAKPKLTLSLPALFLGMMLSVFTLSSAAADWYVATTGSNAPGNGTSPAQAWQTINYAVSQAQSGDRIFIAAGEYFEQVTIDGKNLSLIGSGMATTKISAPDVIVVNFPFYHAIISAQNASNIIIQNLTVDGRGKGTDGNLVEGFLGIGFNKAGGLVENCAIVNANTNPPYQVKDFNHALYANTDVSQTLVVRKSSFGNFLKNALYLQGVGLSFLVEENVIEGPGPLANVSQNGIEISFGPKGTVAKNIFKNLSRITPEDDFTVASAIVVLEGGQPINITSNVMTDCQTGVYFVETLNGTISQNKITMNQANLGGVQFWSGILIQNATATISFNELDGGGGGELGSLGIDVATFGPGKTSNATVNNNIVNNFIYGIAVESDDDNTGSCPTATITKNKLTANHVPLYNYPGQVPNPACPIPEAPCNWYGSANEDDFTNEKEGFGHIIGEFNYTPWLTNGTDAQPDVIGFQPLPDVCDGRPCVDLQQQSGLKETFPNTFNTSFYKSLYNKTFTGSSGTWTVYSNENATMVVTKPYYSPSTSHALKVVNFKTYNCGSGWTKAISPKLNLSGPCCPDNVKFNFTLWTYNVVCNDHKAKLEIDFSADGGQTWTEVWSRTSGQLWSTYGANAKTLINIPVPASYQNSEFRYRIRGEMAAGNYHNFYVFIDDIHFTSPTVCPPLGSIGDFVWKDVNANGKQDVGEPGIENATVKLTMPGGNTVTKTTNAAGAYLFTGLAAGTYTVTFTTPNGFEPTVANTPSDDAIDSDPVNGIVTVNLAAGQHNKTIDAGFKTQVCTNTVSHKETFPNKFNSYITTSLYNKTFVGSSGTWTVNSNSRGSMAVTAPYYSPSSSYALKVVNFNTNGCGAGWTKAVSPKINLSDPCCPSELKMTFTLWTYKVVAGDYKAKLEIDFSKDNGQTWTEVWSKSSANLHYYHGANGKTTVSISVPLAYQNSNFRYRIRGEMASGDCYNFYVFLDDIKIASPATCPSSSGYYTSTRTAGAADKNEDVLIEESARAIRPVEEVTVEKAAFSAIAFPNPSADHFELRVTSKETDLFEIRVTDMLGRIVKTLRIAPNSTISFGTDFKAGTYLAEIRQGEKKQTIKLIKL